MCKRSRRVPTAFVQQRMTPHFAGITGITDITGTIGTQ
jgi:hypothetical protein